MSTEPVKPRTVWTYPDAEDKKPSLVRLTADHLGLAVVPAADLEKTVAALNAGGDVVSQNLPLAKITHIEGDIGEGWADKSVELTVTYKLGDTQTETATFHLAGRKDWDELSAALLGRFGPGWERDARKNSPWLRALLPFGVTVLIGLLFWKILADAARMAAGEHVEAFGSGRLKVVTAVTYWIMGWVGVPGTLILGGLVLLGCVLWLGYMLAYPGVHVALRSKERP